MLGVRQGGTRARVLPERRQRTRAPRLRQAREQPEGLENGSDKIV
jgi:hypothetical protein